MHECIFVKCSNADHPSRDKPSRQGWCFLRSKWEEFGVITLSLRRGLQDDAAIHRGSRNADGFVCSLTGSQWIATGYALAMTIIGEKKRTELTFHSLPFNLHTSFTGFFGGISGNRDNYYLYLTCIVGALQNVKHSHHHPKTLRA